MKKWLLLSIVGLVSVFIMVGCTPPAAPTPAPMPVAPQVAPAIPAPAGPALSAEEKAWAEVVKAARKEGQLVAYMSTSLCCEPGQAVAKAFKEKYGITLEILSLSGRQITEKITVEQQIGRPVADFMQAGVSSSVEVYTRGLLVSIINDLPVMKDKSVFMIDPVFSPGGEIVNLAMTISTILVSDRVRPEDYPRSYKDFLHPKWKGKMIITDPRSRGGGSFQMYSTHGFYKTLDEDFWRALMKQEPALWGGSEVEKRKMVGRGEFLIDIAGGGTAAGPLIAEGAPMRGDLAMEEGTAYQGDTMEMIKNALHPNAVRVLFNWLLSKEGQDLTARVARPSIRKDVPDYTTPRARVVPKRVLNRSWEVAIYGDNISDEHLEAVFGKR